MSEMSQRRQWRIDMHGIGSRAPNSFERILKFDGIPRDIDQNFFTFTFGKY